MPVGCIAALALCVVLPFLWLGIPSGHDFEFHMNSWLEAVGHWKQGHSLSAVVGSGALRIRRGAIYLLPAVLVDFGWTAWANPSLETGSSRLHLDGAHAGGMFDVCAGKTVALTA